MGKAKRLKSIAVKSTTVNTDHGAFLRKSYVKQAEVNVDEPKKNKLAAKEIESTKELSKEESGISGSVKRVKFKDGSHAFFKPSKGEPFVRQISSPQDQPNLNFQSFHLNNKNNEKLSLEEHTKFQKVDDGGKSEGIKGHMIDRELTTAAIGKLLNMDHLPDITRRNVNGEEGSIAEDLREKHLDSNTEFINQYSLTTGDDAFHQIAKTDKKAGNKALFDFIVGNADRHGGNFLHKKTKDGNSQMLAFDHGFTFPSSNSIYHFMDYHNQEKFNGILQNTPFTDDFVSNLKNFINSDALSKTIDHIKNNIGAKEANAFKERIDLINEKVIKGKARTTKEVGYTKERFMT